MTKIWRDDDVGAAHTNNAGVRIPGTRIDDLRAVDDVFRRYGVQHTIAVMACGLADQTELVDLIRARGMRVELHCWKHDDLTVSEKGRGQLSVAADTVEALFGKRPKILFPPWNRTSDELEEEAGRLGLTVSARKISLDQFVRFRGDVREEVINFHHWHVPDVIQLERALFMAVSE